MSSIVFYGVLTLFYYDLMLHYSINTVSFKMDMLHRSMINFKLVGTPDLKDVHSA